MTDALGELSPMGREAVKLAGRGWFVFPLVALTANQPRFKSWGTRASNDPVAVESWWRKWPDDNIGVACGPSGLTVVDLDQKKGKDGRSSLDDLELDHGLLPTTLTSRTPTGGTHIYLLGSTSNTVEKIGKGVDTRSASASGQGGYVLAPPSVRAEGDYAWLDDNAVADIPAWLSDLIGRDSERTVEKTAAVDLDQEHNLEWARGYLAEDARPAVEGSGGDRTTLQIAMVLSDKGVSKEAALDLMLEHYNPRCEPPWEPEELRKKIANAYAYNSINAPGSDTAEADFAGEAPEIPGYTLPKDAKGERKAPEPKGLMGKWVWVAAPKWFVRRSDGFRLDEKSFNSMFNYMSPKGNLSEEIFKTKHTMRKFDGFCFRPGRDEFQGRMYNLWRTSGVKPANSGGEWLEEHVRFMLPVREEADALLDYLAWMVQRPTEKMTFAVLLQGGQGIGKSWLGRLMETILGAHNTSRPTNEQLHSDFNSWASGAQLVVIEELMTAGRRDTANKLKTLITDPTVTVNEKHKHPYTIENGMNFLIFTNYGDPIPLDNDDRRYMVFASPTKKKEGDEGFDYYTRLHAKLHGEGPSQAMGYLMRRDLEAFNGKGPAPFTEGKEQMRRASMSDVEAFLLDLYDLGEAPLHGSLVCSQDLVDVLPDRLKRAPRLHNTLAQFLRVEIGGRNLGQHRIAGGSRRVLWSVRMHDEMEATSAPRRAEMYDAQMEAGPKRSTATGQEGEVVPLKRREGELQDDV